MVVNAARWCNTIVTELELSVGVEAAARILQVCGRDCAHRSGVVGRLPSQGAHSIAELYASLHSIIPDLVELDRGELYITYPRCFCSLVQERLAVTPHLHCECSVGWIKAVCAAASPLPVDVDLLQSVIRGADRCHFRVRLAVPENATDETP